MPFVDYTEACNVASFGPDKDAVRHSGKLASRPRGGRHQTRPNGGEVSVHRLPRPGGGCAESPLLGREAVRQAYASVWQAIPDAQWRDARHFVAGDRGVSEWRFTGTRADGSRVEVNGVDIFTFRDGRIQVKNSYRKDRPPLPAR